MRFPVILMLATLLPGLAAAQDPAIRDAASWPFAATSPWNTALGDRATTQQITSPGFSVAKGGGLNCLGFSHPVYVATGADPEVAVFRAGTTTPFAAIRVPVEAKPDPMGDGHLHVIDETHRSVVEMWQAKRNADGSITARAVARNDLTDDGVYPAWHGVRAYGGSAIAGLIRTGELTTGIRHALAIAVEQKALNRQAPGGKAYVWPASSCDNNNAYSSSGNLFMGSLLAIPPHVDVRTMGLRGPTLELAIALQDYGAYITDCTGMNLSFYAEPAAAEEVAQVGRGEVSRLVELLQVVTNNTPQSVGGGGTPRRPSAPPFALPGQTIVDGGLPPALTAEPTDVTVQAGESIRLAVVATGSEPLSFRWRRSGASVGGNAAELVVQAARPLDGGLYTCTISNAYGRVTSTKIRVTIQGGEAVQTPRPPAQILKTWNKRLLTAVRAALTARRVLQYRSDMLRTTVSVQACDADDALTVAMAGGATMQVAWTQLRDAELASLAVDVTRGDDPALHAVAGFFLMLAGDVPAARLRLARAGAEAAVVDAIFGVRSGG